MFGQQLINGIMLGSVYGLAGLGMTLMYAVTKFLNLAHGQTIVVAAYMGFVVAEFTGNVWYTIIAAVVVGGLVAVIIERFFLEKVRRQPPIVPFMIAIGLGTMMEEGLRMVFFGGRPITYPSSVQVSGFIEIGAVRFSHGHILGLGITVVVMAILYYILNRSSMGRALRATAENAQVAQLLGVNDAKMVLVVFLIAGALAGVSGAMYGIVYAGLSPYLSGTLTFKALSVVLFAGAGNAFGAVAAGLILGVIEISSVALGAGSWRDVFAFGLIILVLLYRPSGLFGSMYEE